jgi:hypothetical protein
VRVAPTSTATNRAALISCSARPAGFDAHINLDTLTGATGLRLNGVAAYDFSGIAVAGAGDIDGDGYDDLIIGASQADPVGAAQEVPVTCCSGVISPAAPMCRAAARSTV